MKFTHAVILYNKRKNHHRQLAAQLQEFLAQRGVDALPVDDCAHLDRAPKAQFVISLGGDGTTLRAARKAAALNLPLLSLNAGTLGFLSACDAADFPHVLQLVLDGKFTLQERFMLGVRVAHADGRVTPEQLAFNDCVIKASQPRAFYLQTQYNDKDLKSYFGDGIIVSTPTGSTAYSLAAGGPIVEPSLDVFLITPICPHTLYQRPIILPAEGELTFAPRFKNKSDAAVASVDGQVNYALEEGDRVIVSRSQTRVQFIDCGCESDFFHRLHKKLKWGQ